MIVNKIGLAMGILGLILSIYWGHLYYKNKRETKELIAKSEQNVIDIERRSQVKQDSISLEVNRRDSAIRSLSQAQLIARQALNEAVLQGKSLAADLRRAKADRDTLRYYAKCDSLAEHIVMVEAENEAYQGRVDALTSSYVMQLANKDALLRERDTLYGKLREAFVASNLKINDLEQTNRKLDMKLEKSKRTTRLVAIIGAVAIGTVYVTSR